MTKTLQPEDTIAQYRVVGPLGAGGMGEVYLAQDRSLERNVALKVLPPDLVRSEDRVKRFVQEAKSASSLNHPNIVTIYEIGAEKVRSSSGAETGPVRFISMELVSGKTLGAKIHEEKVDVRTLMGHLAQAAEGIAKAHAAGIVHRDLKPGNIMVSDDGFAKVLDFGLAKLTEKRLESASASAMTEAAELTGEGAVMGTVHYMSPEQVQGKSVDHRSDIFSFGCLLYEAATRRRPFIADSNVETMHKILHEKPAPIEEINPGVPAELRRLIRRCLAKAPDQRLQSMKDVAIELREIVDEYETLSASTTSATTVTGGGLSAITGQKSRGRAIVVGAVVVAAAAVGFGIWSSRRGAEPGVQPFQNMRTVTQTSRGDVNFSALSADGRYLAYIAGTAGRSTLRVRQVATGSDVEILPLQAVTLESPSFSPDGNYLYFLKRVPEQPNYRSLVRMPSLGGPEEQRGFDVDSRVSFSPDAKRVCFMRGVPQEERTAVLIRDLDAGTERELVSVRRPEVAVSAPCWSPDGKRIAMFTLMQSPDLKSILAVFDAESGRREDFFSRRNALFVDAAWMPDGRGLVVAGTLVGEGVRNQLFVLTYPQGVLRRVTNDFDEYTEVSVAGGEGAIGALRLSQVANLFVADVGGGPIKRLTSATSTEHSPFGFTVSEGQVLYGSIHERRLSISAVPIEGGETRRVSSGPGHATRVVAAGGRLIFQRYDDDGQHHVWRVNEDGAALQQLTAGTGENLLDVSRDGSMFTFARSDTSRGVWLQSVAGGEPRLLASDQSFGTGFFTSDGEHVIVAGLEPNDAGFVQTVFRVLPVSGGPEIVRFAQPPQAVDADEAPDSHWSFLDRNDPAQNVFAMPITGGPARQLTDFTESRATDHEWSPDFRLIAVVRRDDHGENLWVVDADGRSPVRLTQFDGQEIFQVQWTRDSRRVVVRAGTHSRDAVLVTDFR